MNFKKESDDYARKTKGIFIIITVLGIFISSCTMGKRLYAPTYRKCPYNNLHVVNNINKAIIRTEKINNNDNPTPINYNEIGIEENLIASIYNSDIVISNSNNIPKLFASITSNDSCDNIILKDGTEISAKVEEISESIIKYRRCDNLSGPLYSISKSKVFMIKYSNGNKDIFDKEENQNENNKSTNDKTKTEGFGIIGFAIGIFSIPIWLLVTMIVGLVAGILSIVFGAISLSKIHKYPQKYKGRGFGIVSFIVGILLVVFSIILMFL